MLSDDIKNLLLTSDYFLALAYLLVFGVIIHFLFKKSDPALRRIAYVALLAKGIAVIVNCILIISYWKTGDSLSFFSEGETFSRLIGRDITNIRYLVMPLEYYQGQIGFDSVLNSTVSGASSENNFMVSRFTTVFYLLGAGRFLIVNLFFAFIALIGQVKIIELFSKYYPGISKVLLAVGVIFTPSLLFYASPLYKETLCISMLGLIFYSLDKIITAHKGKIMYAILLAFCSMVVVITKNYLFYSLILAAVLTLLLILIIRFCRKSIVNKIIFLSAFIFLVILIANNTERFDGLIYPVVENLNHFQDLYVDPDNESSTFKLGEIDLSFAGLLQRIPVAIYTALFRPHLWEITKPILIINSVESVIMFLLFAYLLIFHLFSLGKMLSKGLSLYLFVYSLLIFAIVGLTTFNFGTLVRYKNPGLIFFNIFIILCFYHHNKKRQHLQAAIKNT